MTKVIKVKSCQVCPYEGTCIAWKGLTKEERLLVVFGVGTPETFVLEKCPLDDEDK